ncbi:MAG: threonylcarbamoyl-AMP synthase, partial [Betaproteobacteria bacterium RIFCSPLOWO2_02_FULL_64_12]
MSDVQENLPQAVAILRGGGLVAFPTETVYGLGADAANPAAMARLYAVKGRPRAHPVIVHLGRIDWLRDWARDVPEFAHKLALAFWPGPLTLVLKRAEGVADALTGGQDTVGVRVPAHPLALALLAAFGGGIAAPSAN